MQPMLKKQYECARRASIQAASGSFRSSGTFPSSWDWMSAALTFPAQSKLLWGSASSYNLDKGFLSTAMQTSTKSIKRSAKKAQDIQARVKSIHSGKADAEIAQSSLGL
eukprot:3092677-Amphidinium_carterae.1